MVPNNLILNYEDSKSGNSSTAEKTIVYKIEQGIREVRDSKEASLKLYHYLNKAIKHSRMKMEQVKQVRYSEPLPQSKTEQLNIVRFTEQSNPLSVKRQFFDVAL
jgi:hypothetical protein